MHLLAFGLTSAPLAFRYARAQKCVSGYSFIVSEVEATCRSTSLAGGECCAMLFMQCGVMLNVCKPKHMIDLGPKVWIEDDEVTCPCIGELEPIVPLVVQDLRRDVRRQLQRSSVCSATQNALTCT